MSLQPYSHNSQKNPRMKLGANSRHRNGWVKAVLVVAVLIAGVGAVYFGSNLGANDRGRNTSNEPVKKPVRGELLITVVEDGNMESASNVDVKCQVAGGSSILWIVADGEYVQAGDKIVELDSSALEDQISSQKNVFNAAKATLIQAQQDYEVALISVREYEEGTYTKDLQDHDKEITIAQENLRSAESALEHAQMMFRKGYVSSNELDAQKFAVQRAELELASSETAKRVLEEFTKTKTLEELKSQADIAEARKDSEEAAFQLEDSRLKKLEAQKENCLITAPSSGMIVYANERGSRFGGGQGAQIEEGASVRERQTLVRLPDLTKMQVKVNVHESKVEELQPGMPATIVVQGQKYRGVVESIANQPEQTSWFQGNVKEYATIVKIDGDAQGLKPGMTSEVTILVARLRDVLYLPLACVVENRGHYYVWRSDAGKPVRTEVKVGLSNESFVEIQGGIEEDTEVFENPMQFEQDYLSSNADIAIEEEGASDFGDATVPAPSEGQGRGQRGGGRGGEAMSGGRGGAQGQPSSGGETSGRSGGASGGEAAAGGGRGGRGGGGDPSAFFARLDADKDGSLTEDEMPSFLKDRFGDIDTDGDGNVSKEEFSEGMKQMQR
jgi:HlyD family secretion protein